MQYERRVVCFFDILGWKEHIKRAGSNPEAIAKLAELPKIFGGGQVQGMNNNERRLTSFSDCVVVSCLESEVCMSNFIVGLSKIFLGAAYHGFFLRAGVTVGDIYHDETTVFGPALNRAHELESTGDLPRIILDERVPELESFKWAKREDGTLYVDAFECIFESGSMDRNHVLYALSGVERAIDCSISILKQEPSSVKEKRRSSSSPIEKLTWLHSRARSLINDCMNQRR